MFSLFHHYLFLVRVFCSQIFQLRNRVINKLVVHAFGVKNMVEASRSSPAITIAFNGYSNQEQLFTSRGHKLKLPCCRAFGCWSYLRLEIKSSRRNAKINGQNGFVTPRIDRLARSTSTDDARIIDHKVASTENTFVQQEKENFDVGSLEHKLPPWGNFAIQDSLEFQSDDFSQPSRISKGKVIIKGIRLHFLEERDEEVLSERILSLSRSNKVVSALSLYRSMVFSGLRPNVHACNSLLTCLLRNQMVDEALIFFDFMKASEMTTGHTYSLILKAIASAWGCDAAQDMFEDLVGKSNIKKEFDVIVYNTIISVCGKVNNWVQTERIWRILKDNGHVGTTVTYRLLVCIFVRCGQNELALDAYHEMIQNRVEPADDALQAIIGACSKEGKWDLALSVFQNMLNRGLKPNAIACNALINSLGKTSKVDLALKVYAIMKSLGHAPDAYTWNALLGALYKANQHADALQLFQSIQAGQSSVLNLHLYNTALMSCQRLGSWDRALQLLWQMEASGLPISTASYNLVIGTCEVARRPHVALQVYEHMLHQRYPPDMFTLLSLIRGCIWGSLWDEMEEILNRVPPNGSLYNASIQGMCLRGNTDSAKKLYMKMRESGFKPDGKTRALMLQNLSKRPVRRTRRFRVT